MAPLDAWRDNAEPKPQSTADWNVLVDSMETPASVDRHTSGQLPPSASDGARSLAKLHHNADIDTEMIGHLRREAVIDRATIANLEYALVSSRRIGTAIGIFMAQHKVTADAAFALHSAASQSTNRKLREIADVVVDPGTTDTLMTRLGRLTHYDVALTTRENDDVEGLPGR